MPVTKLCSTPLHPTINPDQPPREVAHPERLRTTSIFVFVFIFVFVCVFVFSGLWEVVVVVIFVSEWRRIVERGAVALIMMIVVVVIIFCLAMFLALAAVVFGRQCSTPHGR